jgi:LPS-assembly protein
MKNNFKTFLLFLVFNFLICVSINANEEFVFDVTELEILENGNLIIGTKKGKVTVSNGNIITANNFKYNKISNILEASGNVKFDNQIDEILIFSDLAVYNKNKEEISTYGNSKAINNDIKINAKNFIYNKPTDILNANNNVTINDASKDINIYSQDITYKKKQEEIFSKGPTSALIEGKYIFESKDVLFLRNIFELSSNQKTLVKDKELNQYELDQFNYQINKKFLKGKNVNIISVNKDKKNDKYFFSEGFFDLKNKSFVSKKTKIKLHKDVFDNIKQDPRLYGVSSKGDNSKTIVSKGIFTSCKETENCPAWSIKSEEITHDKIKQNMVYKNAVLKLYDVPVLYFPKFFHPDPSVERRSGFLQPQFNNSKILGSSLYIPYFKVLSESKDLTFKPTIFKDNKYILQSEYRQKTENSNLIADFALTKGYQATIDKKKHERNSISHFFLKYDYDLALKNYRKSLIEAKIERVSNDTYLKVFQNNLFSPIMPREKDVMKNEITLNLNNSNQSFLTGFEVYENLGNKKNDRYQHVFPYYEYSKNLFVDENKGSLYFSSFGSNNLINTNNLTSKLVNNFTYRSPNFISNFGFENNFGLYLRNFNTVAKKNVNYKNSPQIDGMSLLEISSNLPLTKIGNNTFETLTPKISFRVNPKNNMKNNSDKDSRINTSNIFNIDRLKLSDSYEPGKSLTLGIDYKYDILENYELKAEEEVVEKFQNEINFPERSKQLDKYLELKLATVFRDKEDFKIPEVSTLNRKSSDIFGSVNAYLFNSIDLGYDFSLDNDIKTINSNSINSTIYLNNFVTTFNFIEERGNLGTSHVLKNTSVYKFNENNFLSFETRRNKEINLTEYYDLSYEYRNDCLKAAIKYNKVFYQDQDLEPSEDLFLTISIIPLTTYERSLYKR